MANGSGGVVYGNAIGEPLWDNLLLTGNSANKGGMAFMRADFKPVLNHCTIAANQANDGHAFWLENTVGPTVQNSIVWANSGAGSAIATSSATFNPADCVIEGGWATGLNIITADPEFTAMPTVNAPTKTGNFKIETCSSARNVGNNTLVIASTDLIGKPRVYNGQTDMGAYEFIGPVVPCNPLRQGSNTTTPSLAIFPNPATSVVSIELTDLQSEIVQYQVLNLQGQIVLSQTMEIQEKESSIRLKLQVDDFVPGVYIIQIHSETIQLQQRLIVQ